MLDWEYYPNCESALNGSIVIFKEYTIIKKDFFSMDHILINFIMLSMENTIIIKEYENHDIAIAMSPSRADPVLPWPGCIEPVHKNWQDAASKLGGL